MKNFKALLIVLALAASAFAQGPAGPNVTVRSGSAPASAIPCFDAAYVGSVWTQIVNPSITSICQQTGANSFGWVPAQTTTTAGGGTLIVASGKTATISNSITLVGTDGITYTFPATAIAVSGTVSQYCGTTTTCSATNQSATSKTVYGTVALASASPSTAVVTGISPAFTDTTFICTGQDQTTRTNLVNIASTSASSITITGPNTVTDVIFYVCVGH